VIFSKSNIETRIMLCSSLTNNDIACFGFQAAK
jgi:hypothetical protein